MMRSLAFLLLVGLALQGNSQDFSVSVAEATVVADHVLHLYGPYQPEAGNMQPERVLDADAYYLVDYGAKYGFVIIAADKRVTPVLGYSFSAGLSGFENNPGLTWILNGYWSEIKNVRESSQGASSKSVLSWEKWGSENPTPPGLSVSPLISTQWGQGCYYNTDCPVDTTATGYYCYHVPTGCVATAMAQILRYHEYPLSGTGSHSYLHPQYGTLAANYAGSSYLWNQMPASLSFSAPEVAELMFHCGVGVNMTYGPVSSGSYASDARAALVNYFDYASTTVYRQKISYNDNTWNTMLQTELDNGRPVFYGGVDPNGFGGHAWVVDGYQGPYYHINWGWDGAHNGYFLLTSLSPQGNANFTNFHEAIMGIEPASGILKAMFSLSGDTLEVGDTAYFNDQSFGNPLSYEWSFFALDGSVMKVDTGQTPGPVVYTQGGMYDIQLVVSDGSATDTLRRNDYVMVLPIARFGSSTQRVEAGPGALVDFHDLTLTKDPIASWHWDFGAQVGTSSQQNPSGTLYNIPGSYAVRLTVTTQGGKTGTIEVPHYIDAFPSCDTMFASIVPGYYVAPADQANFSVSNLDLDGLVPYYASLGHSSDWDIYNDVIAPGDTNFFFGATSWFQVPGQADDWLIYGPLTIPAQGALLEWKHLYWLNNKRDGYEVLVSKNGGQVQDFTGVALRSYIDNDPHTDGHTEDWIQQQAELDSMVYGSSQVWIAFHHYGNSMAYVFIDDIHLTSCDIWTNIAEMETGKDRLHVFPNPASSYCTVVLPADIGRAKLELTDVHGRRVFTSLEVLGQETAVINTEDLAGGIYIVTLKSDLRTWRTTLLKQ